jgi:hypothetical protein
MHTSCKKKPTIKNPKSKVDHVISKSSTILATVLCLIETINPQPRNDQRRGFSHDLWRLAVVEEHLTAQNKPAALR